MDQRGFLVNGRGFGRVGHSLPEASGFCPKHHCTKMEVILQHTVKRVIQCNSKCPQMGAQVPEAARTLGDRPQGGGQVAVLS